MEKTKKHFHLFGGSLKLQERINFARHLSIMIKAGMPLFDGLKIIRKQVISKRLGAIVDNLLSGISNGQSLADGLRQYEYVFGEFFVNVVAVGEASGTLAENLMYLSEEIRKEKLLRNKIRSAMIYPIILLVMATAISAFLTFFIFPKILPLFYSLNVELPVTTRILISILNFFNSYLLWIIGGGIAAFIAYRFILKIEAIRFLRDTTLLHTPVISRLIIDVNAANFSRVLAVLLKSGVKIVEALVIVSGTFTNLVYRRAIGRAAETIRKGETLASSLEKEKKIFPPLLSAMTEVGENTGNLEGNLVYISEYFVEEVDTAVKNLTSFMEPLLLVVMGLLVGFIALSIITPIYSLTQSVAN